MKNIYFQVRDKIGKYIPLLLITTPFFLEYDFINTTKYYLLFLIFSSFLFIDRLKLENKEIFFFFIFLIFISFFIIIFKANFLILQSIKFWFGYVLIFYLFKVFDFKKIKLIYLLRIIFATIFVEAIIVNFYQLSYCRSSLIEQTSTLNSCLSFIQNFFHTEVGNRIYGFYIRPRGFAGNSTLSATIAISIFFYLFNQINFKKIDLFLFFLSIIILSSLTGFFLLIIGFSLFYLFNKKIKTDLISIFFIIIVISILITFFFNNETRNNFDYFKTVFFQKFNFILYLFDFKHGYKMDYSYVPEVIWDNHINYNLMYARNILLGVGPEIITYDFKHFSLTSFYKATTGDNGIRHLLFQYGLLGVFILIMSIIFLKKNNKCLISIIILLIGSMHYPAYGIITGQVMLAFYLNNDWKDSGY